MNKQDKRPKGGRGIEWTDHTWNVIGGCHHACQWRMPDGSIAGCYAADIAKGMQRTSAGKQYSKGFEHHYFHPERLEEPLKLAAPAKIFPDSMADLFGAWVPDEHKRAVLDVIRRADWHTFQSLTKAPAVGLQYNDILPPNLWFGASVPPTFFKGRELGVMQQAKMLQRTLAVLSQIKTPIRWLSIEPLSWDISSILAEFPDAIQWAVIGAASNGRHKYQPRPDWVERVLRVLDDQGVAVFFKGNLDWQPWREAFPVIAPLPEPEPDRPIIVEQPNTLQQIEMRLEVLRAEEELIRADYWAMFGNLKQPIDARLARLRAGRKSGKLHPRVETAYHKAVDKVRNMAMVILWRLRPITDEAAKLRTQRANLLYQMKKVA